MSSNYLQIARETLRKLEDRNVAAAAEAPSEPLPVSSLAAVTIPPRIRLVKWEPRQAPLAVTSCVVVTDIEAFTKATLQQLQAAIEGKHWLAGNRSVRDLIEVLEQVGLHVEVTQ